jgi:enediyne biosynthesis protein E5
MQTGAVEFSADSIRAEPASSIATARTAATFGQARNPLRLWPRAFLPNYILVRLPDDPRLLQIVALGILLSAGAYFRDFSLRPAQIVLTFAAGLGTQRLLDALVRKRFPTLRSATITSLSVTLLLRADNLWAHPVAAAAAIVSKFLIRSRGKHLFNPANFGIAVALLVLPGTWVSPGQWGGDIAIAGWVVALGVAVAGRARRADISLLFLFFYLGALAARVAWLGQNWAVWAHQLQSGALLLFAFFMISDPMTTPNHALGRAGHAALVAAVSYAWAFGLFKANAVLWALFVAAPGVRVWDALWPGPAYEWQHTGDRDGTVRESKERGEARVAGAGAVPVRAGYAG